MSTIVNQLLTESAETISSTQLGNAMRLSQKWAKSGLLEGLGNDIDKANMSVLLENQAKRLIVESNTTNQGGATFTANNSTSIGNNPGWTINSIAPRDLFWVGGNGNWSDPIHWALTSGGAGGNCIPSLYDNVFFDINSFSAAGQPVLSPFSGPSPSFLILESDNKLPSLSNTNQKGIPCPSP